MYLCLGLMTLSKHTKLPAVSTDSINVTSVEWVNIGGQTSFPLVKAHGEDLLKHFYFVVT